MGINVTKGFVAVLLLAAGGLAAGVSAQAADGSNAGGDISGVYAQQQQPLSVDGLYAGSLEVLTTDELALGLPLTLAVGSTVTYTASETREHYVFATQLVGGKILIGSDTERIGITCEAYTVECLSLVTTDAGLISSVPAWVTN